ncbi:MAG: sulfite exporter TauE/SafE family protein [Pseudonocardiaceae bacterium]
MTRTGTPEASPALTRHRDHLITLTLALVFGLVIGVSLGALGGGGSILTVPALAYVLDEPVRAATTASLVIVAITALIGAFGHARSGNVRWTLGIVFGVFGVAASHFSTDLNRRVDPHALLLSFAALMLIAAAAMLRRASHPAHPAPACPDTSPAADTPRPPAGRSVISVTALATPAAATRTKISTQVAVKVTVAGLIVGFLTGFLGIGGGFIIVPALVMALDYPMPIAVGTSLLVIALNSAAALAARAGTETFHWALIVPFTLAAIVGSLGGKRIADRVSEANLSRAFAGLLIAVAGYVAIRSGVGLA